MPRQGSSVGSTRVARPYGAAFVSPDVFLGRRSPAPHLCGTRAAAAEPGNALHGLFPRSVRAAGPRQWFLPHPKAAPCLARSFPSFPAAGTVFACFLLSAGRRSVGGRRNREKERGGFSDGS